MSLWCNHLSLQIWDRFTLFTLLLLTRTAFRLVSRSSMILQPTSTLSTSLPEFSTWVSQQRKYSGCFSWEVRFYHKWRLTSWSINRYKKWLYQMKSDTIEFSLNINLENTISFWNAQFFKIRYQIKWTQTAFGSQVFSVYLLQLHLSFKIKLNYSNVQPSHKNPTECIQKETKESLFWTVILFTQVLWILPGGVLDSGDVEAERINGWRGTGSSVRSYWTRLISHKASC